ARAQAEFENARPRASKEQQDFRDYASVDTIQPLLQVLNSFQRALQTKSEAAHFRSGVELIHRQLHAALSSLVPSQSRTKDEDEGVEVEISYCHVAFQFHPDRNPNHPDAEEKFKEVSEAYAILADSEERSVYDRYGHAGLGSAGQGVGFDSSVFQDFNDIFGEFFGFGDLFGGGGGRRRSRVQRGADLREDLTLEFEEAFFGTETQVTVRRHEACEDCRGSGAAPGKSPTTCRSCNGR